MADEEREEFEGESSLTPEQRIELLEGTVGKNRFVLMSVALLLVVVISVSITAAMFKIFGSSSENDGEAAIAMQQKITAQEEMLNAYDLKLAETNNKIQLLENQINNSSNGTIKKILIQQEKAKQEFMSGARSAIYDLAHMVPGSRAWLELYSEQIDSSLADSKLRQITLEKLTTSENVSEEDNFFNE